MPTFGERLQQLREQAGLTQHQLAEASGVNVWTLRGYEQGRREPNWKLAIQLAKPLGVAVEAFADCVSNDDAAAKDIKPKHTPKKTDRAAADKKPQGRPRKAK